MGYEDCYQDYLKNGFCVVKNFLTPSEVETLRQECKNIVTNMESFDKAKKFHYQENFDGDEHYMKSADQMSFFFEREAVDETKNENGDLKYDKKQALKKIAHAVHLWSPVFHKITFKDSVKELLRSFKYIDPVLVQSMIIFKNPEIGGEVPPHQDSTYLYTDPPSAIGIWLPLDDVTVENGCLFFAPGSHKMGIGQRFVRNPGKKPLCVSRGELLNVPNEQYVPVEANKGDCVILHGSVLHKSAKNTSNKSRLVYTYHVVENKDTVWSEENWLQLTKNLKKFPSVYSQ